MIGTLESRFAKRVEEFRRRPDPGEHAGPGDDEVQYLLDALPFIREYHDTSAAPVPASPPAAPAPPPPPAVPGGLSGVVQVTHTTNKNNVLQRYLMHVENKVDPQTIAAVASEHHAAATRHPREAEYFCPQCDAGMAHHSRESMLVCPRCGLCKAFTEMNASNLTYEQEIHQDVVTYYAYKRLNHFSECITSLQGKENTDIPQHVIDAVKAEFKKIRTTTRAEINPAKVREFLKKLKLNKYYEHQHAICNILNGVPAPRLPQALEDRLKAMFAEIQEPFEQHCPAHRKNFLSYGYTLYKFCELLGEDEYLKYFPLLKSQEKLYQQDLIWKKICKDLRWEFIPSV